MSIEKLIKFMNIQFLKLYDVVKMSAFETRRSNERGSQLVQMKFLSLRLSVWSLVKFVN